VNERGSTKLSHFPRSLVLNQSPTPAEHPDRIQPTPLGAATGQPVVESLRTRFQRGVVWSIAAALASSALNFILNILVARLLGRDGFGQFGIVQSTIATVAGLGQLAMGFTATKFVAEFRTAAPARAGRIIGLCSVVALVSGSVAAVVLYVMAPWLAATSLKAPELSGVLQVASVIVFFTVLTGYQMGTLAGFENYRALAFLALGSGAANLVASGLGAHFWGVGGAVTGLGCASAVQWVMFRWTVDAACRREGITISRRGLHSERHLLVSFALPAALGGLSSLPALWLGNAFLVRNADGFAQMALYTAAFSLRSFVFFLPSLVNRVSMSLLNHQRGLRNWHGYGRVFKMNLVATVGAVLAGALIVGTLGPWLLRAFGKDFRVGFPVLLVLLIAAVVESITGSLYQVVQAESRMWSSIFVIMLPRDLLIVLISYHLVPRMGALGLATAYTAGWSMACIATAIFAARIGIRVAAPNDNALVGGGT
jgi:O-antigen/teichoic acid export membrane protein